MKERVFAPIAENIRGHARPTVAQTTFDLNKIPPYDIDYLLTMDRLIEAAGNTLEAFATVRLWYDLIDMDFVDAILTLRNELKPFVEYKLNSGEM